MSTNNSSSLKRWLMLFVLCAGASTLYFLPYMRWVYYTPLQEALGLSHTQFGTLSSVYGITAMVCYFPGGWLADRISTRKLLAFSFVATGLAGFYFVTYPSYQMLIALNVYWGITTTLTFWAAMIKATRDMASSSEQGRFFGLLEGGRGILNSLISMAVLALFAKLGEGVYGLTWVIYVFSVLPIVSGFITWFVFEDTIQAEKTGAVMDDVVKVIKMPKVWLISFVIFANYTVLIGQSYLTPYVTDVFGASVSLAALLGIIRQYVLMTAGGPLGGYVADKIGSPTRVVVYSFVLMLIGLVVFTILPGNPELLMVLVINMVILGLFMYAMRGVYFAIIEEVKIPSALTGAAVGFASLIGFAPEAFMYTVFGNWLDKYPGQLGYKYVFICLTVVAIVGFIASFILLRLVKKNSSNEEQTQASLTV